MTKAQYATIRGHLVFEPGAVMAAATLLGNAAVLAAGVALMQRADWPSYLASQLLLCVGFFQAFAILHECGHGAFVRKRKVNDAIGHWASLFCFQPYASWKHMHRQHHFYVGFLEKDPTAAAFVGWRETGEIPWAVRFGWRSWVPLVAFAQHLVFWTYPLSLARKGESNKLRECVSSVLFLLVAYGGIGWTVLHFGLSFDILPALVLYLMMNELVNLPHHTMLPGFDRPLRLWEQWRVSRSGYYPRGVSELLMLNFNFHTEHHLFPTLPWYRLRACRELVREVLGDRYNEAEGVGWNIVRRRRQFREVASATGVPLISLPAAAATEPSTSAD